MKKKLIYNGRSSTDMGLVIQTPPVYTIPERDLEFTHVPGRNGDIISDNGCYKNVEREYNLAKGYIYGPVKSTVKNGQELYEWLTSAKGKYVRLEDDYDPEIYRLATFKIEGSLTDIFDKAFIFNAKFVCKPQRFLKLGEQPISYNTGELSVSINNLTHFEAKPIIRIENMPSGINANTMLSVKSINGDEQEEISLVTLKGDDNKKITLNINSETEECYYDNETDASNKISLNGKNFPVLKDGKTTLSVSQYDRSDYEIPSYNTAIQSKQEVCESMFSERDQTIASFENKYVIRSLDTLIAERENSFDADSYFTRLSNICDQGVVINNLDYALTCTIINPNSYASGILLECKGKKYEDFEDEFNRYQFDYLELIKNPDEGYSIKCIKNMCVKNSDNKLAIKEKDAFLITNVHDGDETKTFEVLPFIIDSIQEDLPTCIKVGYGWDYINHLNPDEGKMITAIIYSWDFSKYPEDGNRVCIYWKDKVGLTGLFGKAGWYDANGSIINYTWSGLRKSFMPNGNFLSNDSDFQLKFVCSSEESIDKLQYDFGENSSKIFKVKMVNKNNIQILSNAKGFYRSSKQSNKHWEFKDTSGSLIDTIATNTSFKMEYLKESPKYTNENDWPTWLNPVPDCYNSDGTIINEILEADYIKFKVRQESAYYRQYITKDDKENVGDFYNLNAGEYLKDIDGNELSIRNSDSITIGCYYSEIWPDPDDVPEFPFDRANSINNGTPVIDNKYIPDWLRYEVIMKVKFNTEPSKEYDCNRGNDVIPGYYEFVCISGNVNDEKGIICYSNKQKPEINDNLLLPDLSTVFGTVKKIEENDDEITLTLDNSKTVVNYLYKWHSSNGIELYVKNHWYANVNNKIYDIDNNEIGFVSVEPTIYYYPGKNKEGFFKYDNSNVWVHHTSEDETNPILKTSYKDNTVFYYIEKFPESYEEYYEQRNLWQIDTGLRFVTIKSKPEKDDVIYSDGKFDEIGKVVSYEDNVLIVYINALELETTAEKVDPDIPEWIKYIDIVRKPEGNVNPLSIEFKIKDIQSEGYYKANSLVHWKFYANGEVCLESLVSETNTLSHLIPKTDLEDLNDIKITITPNWWML